MSGELLLLEQSFESSQPCFERLDLLRFHVELFLHLARASLERLDTCEVYTIEVAHVDRLVIGRERKRLLEVLRHWPYVSSLVWIIPVIESADRDGANLLENVLVLHAAEIFLRIFVGDHVPGASARVQGNTGRRRGVRI